MTTTIGLITGFGVAGMAIAAFYVQYRWSRIEIVRLRRYGMWSDRFFDAARPLVSDADTPEEILRQLDALNDAITDRRASKLVERALFEAVNEPSSNGDLTYDRFFESRPELMRPFMESIHAGVIAVSYLSNKRGERIRALIAEILDSEPKHSMSVARQVEKASGRTPSRSDLVLEPA